VDKPIRVWHPHVAAPDPPPPQGAWACGCHPRAPRLVGTWRRRIYKSTWGRSGDHDPSCQAQAVRLVTQKARVRSRITLRPPGWTHWRTTPWRTRPPDMQISSQRTTMTFWSLSSSLAMIEERRPSMWWSASTTMRLAHTPKLDTLAGGIPVRMYRQ
jgi:hypothetical protein